MRIGGGKNVNGASVGILMLESRFPRVPGDTGNAGTWPFPVLYRVVPKATPDAVVRQGARAEGLLEAFVASARDMVRDGADGITTTCGFLSLYQDELKRATGVPVAASSLMQVPLIDRLLPPGQRTGILTISRASLTAAHLSAAGVAADTPIWGTDGGREFSRAILGDEAEIDFGLCRLDLEEAARALVERHPEIGAIVLECTNMTPFAADIRRAIGRPVYGIYNFVTWFQSGLRPRRFAIDQTDM